MKRLLIFLLRAYQVLHVPFFRGSCRFHPTCSQYAIEAVELHGSLRGSWLALRRLARCQPFCRGGFDPVPEPPGGEEPAKAGNRTGKPGRRNGTDWRKPGRGGDGRSLSGAIGRLA